LLGRRFAEQFYYTILPREDLVFGVVAYVDNRPAGFVAATHDAARFMQRGLRRQWLPLVWVFGTSLLLEPKSMGAVWKAWRMMRNRRPATGNESAGEILSFGVLAEYRELPFLRQTGLRISTDLLDSAVVQLHARGARVIRALVEANNIPAKLFYSGLGWTLNHPGVSNCCSSSVEFVWRACSQSIP
jgi:ribosomal protein S18 acetylase RimI-like enzyme